MKENTENEQKAQIVEKAMEFAMKCHKGQMRSFVPTPFCLHPIRVLHILTEYTHDLNLMVSALLHDTKEDTGVTDDEIREQFGETVLSLVNELTSSKQEIKDIMRAMFPSRNKNDREPYHLCKTIYLIRKFKSMSPNAQFLKLVDRLDNVKGLKYAPNDFRDAYAKETLTFLTHIMPCLKEDPEIDLFSRIRSELAGLGFRNKDAWDLTAMGIEL